MRKSGESAGGVLTVRRQEPAEADRQARAGRPPRAPVGPARLPPARGATSPRPPLGRPRTSGLRVPLARRGRALPSPPQCLERKMRCRQSQGRPTGELLEALWSLGGTNATPAPTTEARDLSLPGVMSREAAVRPRTRALLAVRPSPPPGRCGRPGGRIRSTRRSRLPLREPGKARSGLAKARRGDHGPSPAAADGMAGGRIGGKGAKMRRPGTAAPGMVMEGLMGADGNVVGVGVEASSCRTSPPATAPPLACSFGSHPTCLPCLSHELVYCTGPAISVRLRPCRAPPLACPSRLPLRTASGCLPPV